MAKAIVEVYECDRCGKEPANSWIITGPGGHSRQIDLCDQHGAPIANAYALAKAAPRTPVKSRKPSRNVVPPEPAAPPVAPVAPVPEPIWR